MTNGAGNTASGSGALSYLGTGDYNVAAGYHALFSYSSGPGTNYYNTATGYYALALNTYGAFNSAHGALALGFNTTGTFNTAHGNGAMSYNTTGSFNTASGLDTPIPFSVPLEKIVLPGKDDIVAAARKVLSA